MNCKYCGGVILDTDIVCPNCNSKVIRENQEIVENFYEPIEKKNHNGILVFIIILLLGVIGGGYYYVTRPDVVFNVFVNNLYEKAYQLSDEYKQTKMNFEFNLDIDAGSEYKDITDLVKDLKFKSSVNTDLENKKVEFGVGIDYKDKDLINALMYFDKNTIYIDLKDIFNKLIKYELEEEIENLNITEEDINIILNNIFYAFKEALKEGSYLSQTEKDINKYTLVINNESKNMMNNKFVDYLLNSSEYIDTLSRVSENSKEEIIKSLNNAKEEVEDLEEVVYISIYTKMLTNDFVKLEVGTEENIYFTFTKTDEKIYKLETRSIDDTSSVVTITNDNNKTTLVYDISNEDIKAKAIFNIVYTYNESINMNLSKESVLINELTEEDANKMLENLMNNEDIKEIVEVVTSLMPQEDEENMYDEKTEFDDQFEY